MSERLVIEDGPTIRLRDRPAQGTRHEARFGVVIDTGEAVVVKLERIPGALERERAALAWLGTHRTPVPRLLAAGPAVLGGDHVECLVTARRPGASPTSTEGWWRMGRAHARLGDLRLPGDGLPILDPVTFGRQHGQRVSDLGRRLGALVRTIPDWTRLISPDLPVFSPLVITHGDPGPGNYLDDGHEGALIDWEQAHVAGIQFVHHRWKSNGRPAPWEDAMKVLQTALADDLVWLGG